MFKVPEDKIKPAWPSIEETTTKPRASKGLRSFKIQDARNTWEVKGRMEGSGIVRFFISGFPNYVFLVYKDGEIHGYKDQVKRESDSGKLSSHEGRFNLYNNEGEMRTVRLNNLAKYVKEAFSK